MRLGLRHIAVFNVKGTLYAIEDACAHMKAPLSNGRMKGTRLTCSRHGWIYDISDGRRVGKEIGRIRTYPIKTVGGEVLVDPDDPRLVPDPPESGEGEDELPPII